MGRETSETRVSVRVELRYDAAETQQRQWNSRSGDVSAIAFGRACMAMLYKLDGASIGVHCIDGRCSAGLGSGLLAARNSSRNQTTIWPPDARNDKTRGVERDQIFSPLNRQKLREIPSKWQFSTLSLSARPAEQTHLGQFWRGRIEALSLHPSRYIQ